jgi:hypothetical protein
MDSVCHGMSLASFTCSKPVSCSIDDIRALAGYRGSLNLVVGECGFVNDEGLITGEKWLSYLD